MRVDEKTKSERPALAEGRSVGSGEGRDAVLARAPAAQRWWRVKVASSPLPCTSTNCPPPVITRLKSTSASWSSRYSRSSNSAAVQQADADRRDAVRQHDAGIGTAAERPAAVQRRAGHRRSGDERAVDGRGARAAVGFEHVAVDPERALAELVEIDDGPQAAADQPLDLDAAAVDLAALVARLAGVGGAGQHAVLGGEPALAACRRGTAARSARRSRCTGRWCGPCLTSTLPGACRCSRG